MKNLSSNMFMILAMIGLASCTNEIVNEESTSVKNIQFLTNVGRTRALTTSSNLNKFTVTSYISNGDVVTKYIDNQEIGKVGSIWEPVGTQILWPHSGQMKFYAFAPSNAKFTIPEDMQSQPTLNYTVAKNNESQSDLLYAVEEADCEAVYTSQGSKKVMLNFRHALSALQFVAKNENEDWIVNVSKVTLCNVASTGKLTVPADVTTESNKNADMSIWSELSNKKNSTLDIRSDQHKNISAEGEELNSESDPLFVIPQSCEAWNPQEDPTCENDGSYFIIDCSIFQKQADGTAGVKLWPKDNKDTDYGVAIPVPNNTVWEPGKKYVYTINFSTFGGYIPPIYRDDPGQEVIPEGVIGEHTLQKIMFDVHVDDYDAPANTVLDM